MLTGRTDVTPKERTVTGGGWTKLPLLRSLSLFLSPSLSFSFSLSPSLPLSPSLSLSLSLPLSLPPPAQPWLCVCSGSAGSADRSGERRVKPSEEAAKHEPAFSDLLSASAIT